MDIVKAYFLCKEEAVNQKGRINYTAVKGKLYYKGQAV